MLPLDAEFTTPERRGRFGLSPRQWALLCAIVFFGAVVRFWNLNWDHGAYDFHADERTLNEMVRRLGPDLNPHFYYYGTLPIYLYRASAETLRSITGVDWLSQERFLLVGRFYSALASVVTLPFVFAVGRRLWGVGIGLLSAALMSGAGLAIQAAHFSTVESLLTLELMTILWMSLCIMDSGARRWYIAVGTVLGLAMATKLTSASFAVMPLIAHLLRWPNSGRVGSFGATGRGVEGGEPNVVRRRWLVDIALFFGCAAIATLVAEPYYVLGWNEFWQAIQVQTDELSGAERFSYVWQFIGSTPYLFELKNLVVWGLGVPFGVVSLVGWAGAIVGCGVRSAEWIRAKSWKGAVKPAVVQQIERGNQQTSRNPQSIFILAVWPTLYFLYVGTWQARFIRHLMPLVPFCCLFAGGLVAWLFSRDRVWGAHRWGVWLGKGVGGMALVGSVVWGLSVTAIYTTLDTRLAATQWIRENVPNGTKLVVEDKHRPLIPLPDAGHPPEVYQYNVLKVTDPDTSQKMADFAGALATGEWLVVPDRRWSAVLPHLQNFPLTGRYYSLLFGEKLGYTHVALFADPPRLGPFTWSDDAAEETFQVFDHPTVRVFRNTGKLSEEALRGLLGAGR